MKKLLILALTAALALACMTSASAAGKVNVAQENMMVIDTYSVCGYVYARVENTGDKAIRVNGAVMEIYNADGDVMTSRDWMHAFAECLEPGEYTYIRTFGEIATGNAADAVDYSLSVTGKTDKDMRTARFASENACVMTADENGYERSFACVTVENNTDEVVYSLSVVYALLDAEGNILCVMDGGMNEVGLLPGSRVIVRREIDNAFMEYFKAHDIAVAKVDAIVYRNERVE